MKIAIANSNFTAVSAHAGKARHGLVYDLAGSHSNEMLPAPPPEQQQQQPQQQQRITLVKHQVLHTFADAVRDLPARH